MATITPSTPTRTLDDKQWEAFSYRARWGDGWSSLFSFEMDYSTPAPTGAAATSLYNQVSEYGILPFLTSPYRTSTTAPAAIPEVHATKWLDIDTIPTGSIVITTQFTPENRCLTVKKREDPGIVAGLPANNMTESTFTIPATQMECFTTASYGPTLTLGLEAFTKSMTESYISPGVCPYAWSMAAVYAPPAPEPTAPSSLNITSDIPLNTTTSDILPSRTAPSTPGKTWVAPTAWLDFNKRPLEFEYTDEVWGICCPGEDFYFNESDGVCHKMRWRGSQSRNAVPMHVRWHPRTEAIATVSTHDNVAGGGIINAVRSVMYTTTEPAKAQATITGLSFVRMPLKDYSNYDWKSSRGTQSLTSRQIASIVGGAIGGTIFVTVIALACWLGRKKETKSAESVELVPQTVEECYQPTGWAGDAPPPYSASATEDEVPLKKDTDVRWAEIGSSSRP